MNAPPEDSITPVTLGELARGLLALEGRINEKFAEIGRRFDTLQFVPRETYDLKVKTLEDRLGQLEERNRWLARTAIAAFVFPVLVAIIVGLVVTR